ncbi:MAG: TonB-dependent receptor [Polyangiaceae bacterium]|nr:TonB-dependent receptor [Polyangiaceae bacterium]
MATFLPGPRRARHLAGALVLALLAPPTLAAAQPRGAAPAQPRLTKPPKVLKFVAADYPPSERKPGAPPSVEVVLRLSISERGEVGDVEVVESRGPAFDAAAVAAARGFVFDPAEIDGVRAKIRILYRYAFTLKDEIPTTATFAGTVTDRKTKKALPGVTVALDTGVQAVTDGEGHFAFEGVAPGARTVTLSGERLTPLRTEETFAAGKKLEALYEIDLGAPPGAGAPPGDDLEIVVSAPTLERRAVSTEIRGDEAKRLPGTQGDVLKVVESMPGVARSAAGSGQLIVWGASPEDTRVYVDGVLVPRLYHDGGLRSILATELVDTVELAPGAYGAAYGRGLGGIVLVKTKRWDEDRVRSSVGVDLYDASGSLRLPVTKKLRVEAALRRSHVDTLLGAFAKNDIEEYFPTPHYLDGQSRVSYDLGKDERLSLTGLYGSDRTSRNAPSIDPLFSRSETKRTSFYRIYATYERTVDGAQVQVVPSFGVDHRELDQRFGEVPTQVTADASRYATRASFRSRVHRLLTLSAGLDAEVASTTLERSGSITTPAREGDVRVFGAPPRDRLNRDTWGVTTVGLAPYAELDLALLGGTMHVVPGLRFDPTFVSVSRKTPVEGDTPSVGAFREDAALEPRLAVRFDPTPRLGIKAAYARVRQPAMPEDLSAVFGNPSLGAATGDHFLVSVSARLFAKTTLETTAFGLLSDGLAARSPSQAPLLAEALVGVGQGRAYGMQAMLRQELARGFFGWVSYSIVRSERRDAPGAAYRLSDYDQSHVLTALGSYDLGRGFEVGARVRFATGFPRTPVVGTVTDTRRDAAEPLFGAKNTERIPAFFQVDLRVSKRFPLPRGELETYLEVQNVTNRSNPEELVYSRDYRTRSTLSGFPILPVFGLRWNL